MIKIHELKIDFDFYQRIVAEWKKAEIRKNDRNFQVGDFLLFKVLSKFHYPYRAFFKITDILTQSEFKEGLKPGYVMLSIRRYFKS